MLFTLICNWNALENIDIHLNHLSAFLKRFFIPKRLTYQLYIRAVIKQLFYHQINYSLIASTKRLYFLYV